MHTLVTDAEGAVISDLVGSFCERMHVRRDIAGPDGHTGAALAERHIGLIRLPALKLWADVQKAGLAVTQEQCVEEVAMTQNLLHSYNGCSPSQGLLGFIPRDAYDPENKSLGSFTPAIQTIPDAIETSVRMRLMAKDVILKSIVEGGWL